MTRKGGKLWHKRVARKGGKDTKGGKEGPQDLPDSNCWFAPLNLS